MWRVSKHLASLPGLSRFRVRPPDSIAEQVELQLTQAYWEQRSRDENRQFGRLVREVRVRDAVDSFVQLVVVIPAIAVGCLVGVLVLGGEWLIAKHVSSLVPLGTGRPAMSEFPNLAVQVSASLLGLYLAAVSIVVGTSYNDLGLTFED